MLKKLFKPNYVKYDSKYITLSDEDNKIIDTITNDIRLYVLDSTLKCNAPEARFYLKRCSKP